MSRIEWTTYSFNPWWGCVKVSPACDHCYAERDANRYGHHVWGKDAVRRELSGHHWEQPLKWNRSAEATGARQRVFCGSMCDVMEEGAHLQAIRERQLYPLIEATPWLHWLLLTKRPQNFRRFLPAGWLANPLAHVMGMTSVELQEYAWRAAVLLRTPFAARGLSVEPLLGPVDLRRVTDMQRDELDVLTGEIFSRISGCVCEEGPAIDWVIVGGESGPQARHTDPRWVAALRDQCVAARVPFFFKQWGEWLPPDQDGAYIDGAQILNCSDVPERVGKKAAGALLDGREWREMPV